MHYLQIFRLAGILQSFKKRDDKAVFMRMINEELSLDTYSEVNHSFFTAIIVPAQDKYEATRGKCFLCFLFPV